MANRSAALKKVAVIVFVLQISLPRIQAQWAIDDEGCRTPGRGIGECVPIHECDSITNFLESLIKEEINISNELIEHLRSYQCGFSDTSIKVCCSKEMLFPKPVNTRYFTTEEPSPPDVDNHRNLNLLPYDCGLQLSTDRISGGSETLLGEFPWMVLINYSTGKVPSFKCGGTIINDRYILTAAHCITNLNNLKPTSVRVGEHNTSSPIDCEVYPTGVVQCASPVQDILIEEILPHPQFSPTEFKHDVGLLRLAAPINITLENAKPICLPLAESVRNLNFTDTKLTITGWGITEHGRTSDSLLKVNIPILDRSECQRAYQRSSANITYRHLCGGGRNRQDSCGGDSGGPLQRIDNYKEDARYIQYGIVSFGARTCGRVGVPGVYTRLDYYLNWILDTIKL